MNGAIGEHKVFKLMREYSTGEQWAEWLQAPLEHAAGVGDVDLVHDLLRSGAACKSSWRGCFGRTLLDSAVEGGSSRVVSAILSAGGAGGVNNVSGPRGWSLLHRAAQRGLDRVGIALVMAGANVDATDLDGCSSLHLAADEGADELVNFLLANGADPNQMSNSGCTPLHFAAAGGHLLIVDALLRKGCGVAAHNLGGRSALQVAAMAGHVMVVRNILTAGMDVDDEGLVDGFTPLMRAAQAGKADVLIELLRRGASVNRREAHGWTALHLAVKDGEGEDCSRVVGTLVDAGADVDAPNGDGMTPLMYAAASPDYDGTLALLRHGASVKARDCRGFSVLHHACEGLHDLSAQKVSLLLKSGADETLADNDNKTASQVVGRVDPGHLLACGLRAETDRVRGVLTKGPTIRWRRRGLFIMCRYFPGRMLLSLGGRGSRRDRADRRAAKRAATATGGAGGVAGAGVVGVRDEWQNAAIGVVKVKGEDIFRNIVSFL